MRVIIAGGGVGGPLLAHGLHRAGVDVTLAEADAGLGRAGYRLHMNADGGNALQACLPPELFELYLQTSRRDPRRELAVTLTPRLEELAADLHIGPPQYGDRPHTAVDRRTLRSILHFGLPGVLRYGNRVRSYTEDANGVTVRYADGATEHGDVLVAADGARSVIRAQRLPGVVVHESPRQALYTRSPLTEDQLAGLPAQLDDGFMIVPDPANGLFAGIGLFAPRRDVVEAAADLAPGLDMRPVAPYMMIALGWLPGAAPPDPSPAGQVAEALRRTGDWHPALRELLENIDPASPFLTAVRTTAPAQAWTPSRVTMIGDAIHAMPPAAGAGANTALRDAQVLTGELGAAAAGKIEVVEAIGRYEDRMRAHAYPILRASSERMRPVLNGR